MINGSMYRFFLWHGSFPLNHTIPIITDTAYSVSTTTTISPPHPPPPTTTTSSTSIPTPPTSTINLNNTYICILIKNLQSPESMTSFLNDIERYRTSRGIIGAVQSGISLETIPVNFDIDQYRHVPIGLVDQEVRDLLQHDVVLHTGNGSDGGSGNRSGGGNGAGDDSIVIHHLHEGEATVIDYDFNPLLSVVRSTWYTLLFSLSALCFVFNAVYGLVQLARYLVLKLQFSVGVLCLIFEVLGNLLKACRAVFLPFVPQWPLPQVYIVATLAFPFCITGNIVLLFFWLKLSSGSLVKQDLVYVLRIPAGVVCVFLFAVELSSNVARTSPDIGQYINATAGLYFTVYTVVCVLYFVTAFGMRKIVKHAKVGRKKLRWITMCIVYSGVLVMMGAVMTGVSLMVRTKNWSAAVIMYFIADLLFAVSSWLQIRIFQPVKKRMVKNNSAGGAGPVSRGGSGVSGGGGGGETSSPVPGGKGLQNQKGSSLYNTTSGPSQ